MMVHPLRNPTSTKQVLRILDEPPLIEQSYDPPWIAIIVTSKVTKIIGLHQQGRPMLSSEMNHLSNNISVKFWYERWQWLWLYHFETSVGVSTGGYTVHICIIRQRGYPTINWWRHTTNILLDIAIHTEMWLCWVWGYARLMGGKNTLMIGFLKVARERGLYIYPTINHNGKTQQYTTHWILQFMWECGRRINICADRWVEKILQYSWTYVLPSIQCLR